MICTTEAAEADTFNERDGIGNEDDVKQSNTFVKNNTFVQAVLADFLQRVPT